MYPSHGTHQPPTKSILAHISHLELKICISVVALVVGRNSFHKRQWMLAEQKAAFI
jgi:hypothetical protein